MKEDSVRELIIAPIFSALSKQSDAELKIMLSQRQKADFKIGSNKHIETSLEPDYTIYLKGQIHCILDAKASGVNIQKGSDAEKQVLSYVLHFKAPFYALCNGEVFLFFAPSGKSMRLALLRGCDSYSYLTLD